MIRSGLALLVTVLMLGGCAGWQVPQNNGRLAEEHQVIRLIGYAEQIANMTPAARRQAYEVDNQRFAAHRDTISRIRLALVLAAPGTGLSDASRASTLLEPLVRAGNDGDSLHMLAGLIYRQLNDRTMEQKRALHMQKQLEELKQLERTMIERVPGTRSR